MNSTVTSYFSTKSLLCHYFQYPLNISLILFCLKLCAVFVVYDLMFVFIYLAIIIEAVLVGVRKGMTIALVAVSNKSIWKSRLLCEYHLFYTQSISHSAIHVTSDLKSAFYCCVGEINLCAALIQSSR